MCHKVYIRNLPRQVDPIVSGEGLDHGDLDILDGVSWFRNEGGGVYTKFLLSDASVGEPDRNVLVDMDDDGDLDAVIGFGHDVDGKISWYERGVDPTALWTAHAIDNIPPAQAQSVDVADIDADGDMDVVVGEHTNPEISGLRLLLYERQDVGSWVPHEIYSGDEHHDGAQLVDIDQDGDLDVVSIGWLHRRLMLYENQAIVAPGN